MNKLSDAPVIIVGAGIAGLTAAYRLKQLGIETLVLEAESTVGGRMQSVQVEDALIDSGAQFLSSSYSVIPNLIKETGLSDQFIPTNEWVGFVKNNHVALLHPRKPLYLITNKIVSIFDFLRLSINQYKLFHLKKNSFQLNDITSWLPYDNQLA